ncbi:MAG: universal stress protein [Deltaproteobacteria bacterium]|nr:universal stress protein [Deltaproteobacteria bacterium]MCL4874615.1 universal stress protein [bacterium]
MYRNILVCLDNSDHANAGADLAIALARSSDARLTGCHVYAARLHNSRFMEMEDGLPEAYRNEDALKNTREIHDTLITRGLEIISDSYMAVFQARARCSGLDAGGVSREGKNFEEIVKEAGEAGYDLVAMGLMGLGRTGTSRIGSVCERVVRRVRKDVLVSRERLETGRGIIAALDGSPASFGGLLTALELSDVFGFEVEAISAFDPVFHQAAFRSIAGILTEEAGRLFRFREQERLHDEIIDKGLARIYRGHLEAAERLAASKGKKIKTTLLSGKASDEIIKYARKARPFLLVLGRTGAHAVEGLDIGSTAENCLREVPCHVLVSAREFAPVPAAPKDAPAWTKGALEVLSRIPKFASGIVKNMVEDAARKEGVAEITPEFMRKVRKNIEG